MEHYKETDQEIILFLILRVVIIIIFALLFARLVELQVIKGGYYRNLSDLQQKNALKH